MYDLEILTRKGESEYTLQTWTLLNGWSSYNELLKFLGTWFVKYLHYWLKS